MDSVDQYRPEASRLRKVFNSFRTNKKKLILYPDTEVSPFYCSREYHKLSMKFSDHQICAYNPFIGIIPAEISDIFPAAHNLISKRKYESGNSNEYPTFVNSFEKFLSNNSFDDVIIVTDEFLDIVLRGLQLESKIKTYKYTDDIIEQLA
jgi:7-cyano-7-deazaguanine tRNA-ribosyltransferase